MDELSEVVLERMRSSGQSEAKAIEEVLSSIRYQYDDEEWPRVSTRWAVVLKHIARRCRNGHKTKEEAGDV